MSKQHHILRPTYHNYSSNIYLTSNAIVSVTKGERAGDSYTRVNDTLEKLIFAQKLFATSCMRPYPKLLITNFDHILYNLCRKVQVAGRSTFSRPFTPPPPLRLPVGRPAIVPGPVERAARRPYCLCSRFAEYEFIFPSYMAVSKRDHHRRDEDVNREQLALVHPETIAIRRRQLIW